MIRDGFGVGPGPQLSYFCSVLSLKPFASVSRNNYGINGHPRPHWVSLHILSHSVPTMILLLC